MLSHLPLEGNRFCCQNFRYGELQPGLSGTLFLPWAGVSTILEKPTILREAVKHVGHRSSEAHKAWGRNSQKEPPPTVGNGAQTCTSAQPSWGSYPSASPGHLRGYAVTRASLSPGFPVLRPVILHPGTGGFLEIPQPHPGECSWDPLPGPVRHFAQSFCLSSLPKKIPQGSYQP